MKLLHTSDWHLGRRLYGRRRHDEFARFLDWLAETLRNREADALLVAGDVFDSGTPGTRAQEQYYRFLIRAAAVCRHVVIIAGNHDSPNFLNAPKELLKALNVHVAGRACADPADEVLTLRDARGRPELLVCAVPYLHDRDVRSAEPGESPEDREKKLADGIRRHYAAAGAAVSRIRRELHCDIPAAALGHLFAAGGRRSDDDGVRDLYVGTLAPVHADIFAPFDYTALGHLHMPQTVNGDETVRYSGSPLPMGFGEAGQRKSVCIVEFNGREAGVDLQAVPVLQHLESIKGDLDHLERRIAELVSAGSDACLELVYEGEALVGNLRGRLSDLAEGTALEILRVKNNRSAGRSAPSADEDRTPDTLSVEEMFELRLNVAEAPADQKAGLRLLHQETLRSLDAEGLSPARTLPGGAGQHPDTSLDANGEEFDDGAGAYSTDANGEEFDDGAGAYSTDANGEALDDGAGPFSADTAPDAGEEEN
ncbi:MAG: exonuclease SbcCD subunit D C-terminal domain-containing protein [Desulfovibrio sp.]|nr:exonuclease SbcCD subunit D C-terminal domain-containing protein [Desulfovibrio sp.]